MSSTLRIGRWRKYSATLTARAARRLIRPEGAPPLTRAVRVTQVDSVLSDAQTRKLVDLEPEKPFSLIALALYAYNQAALLAQLPFIAPDDTLVFLGDYLDRGPDSRGVIDPPRPPVAVAPDSFVSAFRPSGDIASPAIW